MKIIDKYNKHKQPKKVKINEGNIPKELKKIDAWVCWYWRWDGKKHTKPPCNPDGININHLQSSLSYKDCIKAYRNDPDIAGIGFSLRKDDRFCGIDFDDCLKKGKPNKRLKQAIRLLKGAYIERSPSGEGVRVFGTGKPKTRGSKGAREIEIYNSGRYLTVTGQKISNSNGLLTNIEKACKKIDKKIYKDSKVDKKRSNRNTNSLAEHDKSNPKIVQLRKYQNAYNQDDRDEWIRYGQIIHHETNGSQEGFDFWNWWSQGTSADNYSEEETKGSWKSFKKKSRGEALTISTLIYDYERNISYEAEDIEFENPMPIDIPNLKSIKKGMMPNNLWKIIKAVSDYNETPPELAFSVAMGVIATSVQKKICIESRQGHKEQLSVWMLAALKSGNRKSSVSDFMTYPLMRWETTEAERVQKVIENAEIELRCEKMVIKSLESEMKKKKDIFDKKTIAKQISKFERNKTVVPQKTQIWAQDITTENLGLVMSQQDEKMGLFSSEGGQFQVMAGRYSNGVPNIDLYLQSFSGDPVRVNRGSRDPIVMREPAISMGISPQPSVLKGLMASDGFRDRGFIARFTIFMPESLLGKRTGKSKSISVNLKKDYNEMIINLLNIKLPDKTKKLNFTEEGEKLIFDFSMEIEKELGHWGKFNHITDWAGKLTGLISRIACLFFCSDNSKILKNADIVPIKYIKQALKLSEVIIDHSLASFDYMGADIKMGDARIVYRWLRKKEFKDFRLRDCQKSLSSHFKIKETLLDALDLLVDNYIIMKADDGFIPKGSTRSTEYYFVNPKLR